MDVVESISIIQLTMLLFSIRLDTHLVNFEKSGMYLERDKI
jgi:hypothetical protein